MTETASTMLSLGTKAPDFSLPSTEDKNVKLADFADKNILVVIFMCNHCPFVRHIQHKLTEVAVEYMDKGVAFVGISANDVAQQPDDSFEKMKEEKARMNYPFPYLYDENQAVAKAYTAACTPDIFVFDKERQLVYRGQFDDSRPGNDKPLTGESLTKALDQLLAGEQVSTEQKPSTGCNIKWKEGNEPDYFG